MLKETLARYFANQPDVALSYLFGFEARETAGPFSDVNVAVRSSEQNGNRGTLERYRRRRQKFAGIAAHHA